MKRSINPPRARRRSATPRSKAASGKFVLRLDPQLHADLRREATHHGMSLNEHCAQVMTMHRAAGDAAAAAVIRAVRRQAGAALVGVVVYGSWARGDVADSSDVDLLVVLEPALPITRELYRLWDEQPLTWDGRGVDVHLVHLPEAGAEISGTWAEAATDGIVLFERGLDLSRRLSGIRRRIATGEIVRHVAHGQPYWVRSE